LIGVLNVQPARMHPPQSCQRLQPWEWRRASRVSRLDGHGTRHPARWSLADRAL